MLNLVDPAPYSLTKGECRRSVKEGSRYAFGNTSMIYMPLSHATPLT
jgi:hypothetical protein